jgi:hypothetical protein
MQYLAETETMMHLRRHTAEGHGLQYLGENETMLHLRRRTAGGHDHAASR